MGVGVTAAFVLLCVLVRCGPGFGLTVDPLEAEPVDSEEKTRVDELSTAEPIDYGGNTEDTGPQTFGPPVNENDYVDDFGDDFETGNAFGAGNGKNNNFGTENGDGNDEFETGNGNRNEFENEEGNGSDETGNGYGPEVDDAGDAAFEESNDLKKASSDEINAIPTAGIGNRNSSKASESKVGLNASVVNTHVNTGNKVNRTRSNVTKNKAQGHVNANGTRSSVSRKANQNDVNGTRNDSFTRNRYNITNGNGNTGANRNENGPSVIRNKRRNGSSTRGRVSDSKVKNNVTGSEVNADSKKNETIATGNESKNSYSIHENVNEHRHSMITVGDTFSSNDTGYNESKKPTSNVTTIRNKDRPVLNGAESKNNQKGNEYWNGFKYYVTMNRTKTNADVDEPEIINGDATRLSATGDEIHKANGNENTGNVSENSEVKAHVVEVSSNATSGSTETTESNRKRCVESTSGACAETVIKPESTIDAKSDVNRTRSAHRRSFMKTTATNGGESEVDVQKGESSKRSYNYDETQVPPPSGEIITYDYGDITEIIISEHSPPAPSQSPEIPRYGRQPSANPDPNYGYHPKPYFYDRPKVIPDMRYTPETTPSQDPTPTYYYSPQDNPSSPYPTNPTFGSHAPNQNWDPSFEGYASGRGKNSAHDFSSYSSTSQPGQNFDVPEKPDHRSEYKNDGSNPQFNRDFENYAPQHYANPTPYISPSGNPSSFGPSGQDERNLSSNYGSPESYMKNTLPRDPSNFGPSETDGGHPSPNLDPSRPDVYSEKNPYYNHHKSGPVYEYYGTPKSKTWVSYESIPIKNPSTDSGPPIVEIIYHRENGVVYEDDILDDFTTYSPIDSTPGHFPSSGDFPTSDFPPSHMPVNPGPPGDFPATEKFPTSGTPIDHGRPHKSRPYNEFHNSGKFPTSDDEHFRPGNGRPEMPKKDMKNTKRPVKNRGNQQRTTTPSPPRRKPGSSSRPKTKATSSSTPGRKPSEHHFPQTDVDFDDEDFPDGNFAEGPKLKDFPKKTKVKNSNPRPNNQKNEEREKTRGNKNFGGSEFPKIEGFDSDDDKFAKTPKTTGFDAGNEGFSKNSKTAGFGADDDEFPKNPKTSGFDAGVGEFPKKSKTTNFGADADVDFPKTLKSGDFDADDDRFPKDPDDTDFRNLKQSIDAAPVKEKETDFPDDWQKKKNFNPPTNKGKSENSKNEKHKSEKGDKHDSGHKKSEGKKGEKGSKSEHEHSEGVKGHAEEGKESGGIAKKGGKKKAEEDKGGYYAEKHKGEAGEKKGEFHDGEEHHKGHSTKGKHEIHKKDEFSRKHSFYDEHHEGGKHEKHGGYDKKEKIDKGKEYNKGDSEEGYEEEHEGKEGKFKKGKRYKGDKGEEDAEGKDEKFSHEEEYGKKGKEEKKEENEFEL